MDREKMTELAHGWDVVADKYADELYHELDHKPFDRALLAEFVKLVPDGLPVWDVGCGPGHITAHLAAHGLSVTGFDLSAEMIGHARRLAPKLDFEVANMLELTPEPGSLGGVVLPYSLINLVRADVPLVLSRLGAGMVGDAPLYIAVHEGEGIVTEHEVLGRTVTMAATLFTESEMRALVANAGFTLHTCKTRGPYEQEYPSQRVYVLATRTSG